MRATGVDLATVTSLVPTVAAVVAAVAALAALPFTRRAAEAARAQAEIAREQAQLQLDLLKQSSQPNVWFDIQPDNRQGGGLISMVPKNEGPTMARNIRVAIDPPLPVLGSLARNVRDVEAQLASGIKSLAPGRSVEWSLAVGFTLIGDESDMETRTLTLNADGPFGPIDEVVTELNWGDWRWSRIAPDGTLYNISEAVKSTGDEIKKLRNVYENSDRETFSRNQVRQQPLGRLRAHRDGRRLGGG